MFTMIKRLFKRPRAVPYSVSCQNGDDLTEFELKMLRELNTCPDCNEAGNLYRQKNRSVAEITNIACGRCGAEFGLLKLVGMRYSSRGKFNEISLRSKFHFTDSMIGTVWHHHRQLELIRLYKPALEVRIKTNG